MNETIIQPTSNPTGQQITITLGTPQPVIQEPKKKINKEVEKTEKKIKEDGLPKDNAKSADDLIPQMPYYSDPLFYEVANYFGLKQEDYDSAKNKLADIVEFVIRDVNSNEIEKILPRLRELEDSIQSPGWDERRYANLHKYIRLADKKATIGKMMKAYEKGK
jgi:hypothetical protein